MRNGLQNAGRNFQSEMRSLGEEVRRKGLTLQKLGHRTRLQALLFLNGYVRGGRIQRQSRYSVHMHEIMTADGLKRIRPLSSAGRTACIVILFFVTSLGGIAQSSAGWITNDQQEQIVSSVRTILPKGWTIRQTALNRTPDDWFTLDNRGFEIDGENAEHTFQIWFLPKDWPGIRQNRPNRLRIVYWEGILIGREFKTITNTDQVPVLEALQTLDMHTPSLVNGGWYEAQNLFKGRISEVDSKAQEVVSRFCKDESCKDEAAYSLIVLGVPSRTITLDCAKHAREDAQGFCVSALGYMGGQDSIGVLGDVITDRLTSHQVQTYAAMSLGSIADPSSGPALLRALHIISWADAVEQTAEALGRIHYKIAAPEILLRMKREPQEGRKQVYYARALASLGYKPAVPEIEKLCKTTKLTGDWILKEQQQGYLGWVPEIALMRLTAPWGKTSDDIRLLLLPSENLDMHGQVRVVAVVENVGNRNADILGSPGGDVIVDGARYHRDSVIMDGNITLGVNDVAAHAIDLSGLIADAGPHRVQYQLGTAISNQLIVQVPSLK
jgi:hypothetical protein